MKNQAAHILTLLVDNEFGVLTRITAQIRREGWNIKSLAVAESAEPSISRITLALECFDATLPTVLHRLNKLACVHTVKSLEENIFCRELLVASVSLSDDEVKKICDQFGAKVIKKEDGISFLELTGMPRELDAFIVQLETQNEKNIARTGPITLER